MRHVTGPPAPPTPMAGLRLVFLPVFAALTVCGCAPQLVEAPPTPSAAVQVIPKDGAFAGARGRAQAVWVGNRILTAAHVLVPDFENPVLPSEVLLHGERVRILAAQSGDLRALARAYSQASSDPSEWIEDWVVAEVSRSAPTSIPLRICDRPLRPGDRLYAVGVPPAQRTSDLQVLPLTVVEFHVEEDWDHAAMAALERLVAVRTRMRHDLRGWSGSFVGRYDAGAEHWYYVGLLIFGVDDGDGEGGHVVLRPPPEALRPLMEGD